MEIKRSGSQPSGKGPDAYFTGTVRIDPLFQAPDPATCAWRECDFRVRRSHGMAHPPAWADLDRHVRVWMGAKRR